ASRLARQSLLWSVVMGTPLAVAGFLLARPIIGLFAPDAEVARIGAEYLQVTMGTVVVLVGLFIGGGVLRGAGDSRTPMQVTMVANVVNAVLAYGLIYGNFGLPALGAVGSAWAAFAARALALTLMLVVLWRGRGGVSIRGAGTWRPETRTARQILGIGMPAALEQLLTSAAFFTLVVVVAQLGTATLAAHQLIFTALSSSFLPGFGFAIAATTLVGQSVGARRIIEGDAAARIATLWAVGWMGALGLLLLIFAEPVLGLLTNDPQVIAIGARALRVVALAQPFWAVLFVGAGALRGAGNTRLPLVVGAGGIWVTVLLALALIELVGGGLGMVWGMFLATSPIIGAIYWWRWRRTVAEIAREERAAAAIAREEHAP
ncbi:MAG TPA: MATE family efflux transporter, partial [Roseiflexaceae bacterium]|nr:MATE family efflux transporter [Roseiflexaceae bacterium]